MSSRLKYHHLSKDNAPQSTSCNRAHPLHFGIDNRCGSRINVRHYALIADGCEIVAVASTILTIGHHMLQRGTTYQELGVDYFDKRNLLRMTKRLMMRLEALGHKVIIQPAKGLLQFQPSD
jgi:hypothetical protein